MKYFIYKVKNILLYSGLNKEEYNQIQQMYLAPNWSILTLLCVLVSLMMFGFSVWTFFNESLIGSRYIYLTAGIITAVIATANT